MKLKSLSPRARLNSIRYAIDGIIHFFAEEPNAWVHLFFTILVIFMSAIFKLTEIEKFSVIIVTGMVWVSEFFNTAVERIMDDFSKQYDPRIKIIKDLSASAVFLSAVTAVVAGTIIFIPKILAHVHPYFYQKG